MQEKIIFAPGARGTELLRSLARKGKAQIGTRIVGGIELAEIANTRSGILPSKRFLSFREQAGLTYSVLNGLKLEYFSNISYADAENIARALNGLRSLIPEDEEGNVRETLEAGTFKEKNSALLKVYLAYMDRCGQLGLADTVTFIREAAAGCSPLNAQFITLEEFPLNPLERLLLEAASGENYRECSLTELFEAEAAPVHVEEYTAAYGASNEVEDIIGKIYENGYPLDTCTVAVADTVSYSQLFYDFSQTCGIHVTFGGGIPILNTHPARLLKLLSRWKGEGMCGVDALHDVIFSPSFDRKGVAEKFSGFEEPFRALNDAVVMAGQLRLGTDAAVNGERIEGYREVEKDEYRLELLDAVESVFRDFEKGCSHIIRTYSKIRPMPDGQLDAAAVGVICDSLHAVSAFAGTETPSEEKIIEGILSKTVHSEASSEGCLHICSVSDALSTVREHLFIAGISADSFPGNPRENYLLLDTDYGKYAEDAPVSEKNVTANRAKYDSLLRLSAALGTGVRISYPSYSHSDLKEINASYDMMRSFREEHSRDMGDSDRKSAGFFKYLHSPASAVGREYMSGREAEPAEEAPCAGAVRFDMERRYSPTAIDTWFGCPRQFYLMFVLHMKQPEENDPYEIMDARTEGNIAHNLLETLQPDTGLEDFLKKCEKAFDDYLKKVPPVVPEQMQRRREQFLEMMQNGWEDNPKNTPVLTLSEQDIEAVHPSGVRIHGHPDRVEVTADGKYIIVDYKTGRKAAHVSDDPQSCLQALIYAWLIEETQGYAIDHVEFRYPRIRETFTCGWNSDTKDALDAMLRAFRNGLEEGKYSPCTECDKYCRFRAICEKARKEAAADADI